jgi:crotonobetainyl-CoA:carnitine CoA-transferase CaiB-like acyl-CoA transferase
VNHAPPMAEDKASAQGPGALAGLKVIDLTRVLGGPYCTMVLSDHGAEVIKLEPPQGDETREWGPPFDDAGDASYFIGINRNKESVGLDLSKPAGREVLMRLLEDADVLVENFKPSTMEESGLVNARRGNQNWTGRGRTGTDFGLACGGMGKPAVLRSVG